MRFSGYETGGFFDEMFEPDDGRVGIRRLVEKVGELFGQRDREADLVEEGFAAHRLAAGVDQVDGVDDRIVFRSYRDPFQAVSRSRRNRLS